MQEATGYHNAKQYETVAEYYRLSIEAYFQKNEEESDHIQEIDSHIDSQLQDLHDKFIRYTPEDKKKKFFNEFDDYKELSNLERDKYFERKMRELYPKVESGDEKAQKEFHKIQEEFNFKIHLLIAFFVLFFGILFDLNKFEWVVIIFAIFLVLITEVLNTSIENLADLLVSETNTNVKIIKDIAAGAVLLTSLAATIVGLLVFLPKIWKLLNG